MTNGLSSLAGQRSRSCQPYLPSSKACAQCRQEYHVSHVHANSVLFIVRLRSRTEHGGAAVRAAVRCLASPALLAPPRVNRAAPRAWASRSPASSPRVGRQRYWSCWPRCSRRLLHCRQVHSRQAGCVRSTAACAHSLAASARVPHAPLQAWPRHSSAVSLAAPPRSGAARCPPRVQQRLAAPRVSSPPRPTAAAARSWADAMHHATLRWQAARSVRPRPAARTRVARCAHAAHPVRRAVRACRPSRALPAASIARAYPARAVRWPPRQQASPPTSRRHRASRRCP